MRLRFFLVFMLLLWTAGPDNAGACVGRVLQVGALATPQGEVMAEALSLLINERTGTTVEKRYFSNLDELYGAVGAGKVGLFIENTSRALTRIGRSGSGDLERDYREVKQHYQRQWDLVWLDHFDFVNGLLDGGASRTAILVSGQVLADFPGLPRLLNKLARKITDEDYAALVQAVRNGGEPRVVAREFLNANKLI